MIKIIVLKSLFSEEETAATTTTSQHIESCLREARKTKKDLPLSSQLIKHKQSKNKNSSSKRLSIVQVEVPSTSAAEASSHQPRSSSPAKNAPKTASKAVCEKSEVAVYPFDYSQVDYKGFHRSRAHENGQRRGKGNPARGTPGCSNGRVNKRNQKSLTYSSK